MDTLQYQLPFRTSQPFLNYIKKVLPDKLKNGIQTFLTEGEVTLMKLKLQQNQHLVRPSELPKTDLEKKLLIKQAMNFLNEEIEELKDEVESQKQELIKAQPKIEFHDQVGDSTGLLNMGETAKTLNLGYGRNTLIRNLRSMKIFFKLEPYQRYLDQGYFEVKTTTNNGFINKQTFTTPKGLIWLRKKLVDTLICSADELLGKRNE